MARTKRKGNLEDEEEEVSYQSEREGTQVKYCELCNKRYKKIFRHWLIRHLPWYVDPLKSCWNCRVNEVDKSSLYEFHEGHSGFFNERRMHQWVAVMTGLLFHITQLLGLSSLDQLLEHVIQNKLYQEINEAKQSWPTIIRGHMYAFFEEYHGRNVGSSVYFNLSPPSHIACLCHDSILRSIVPTLPPESIASVRNYATCTSPSGHPIPLSEVRESENLVLVDSHCNLYATFVKTKTTDLEELEEYATIHKPEQQTKHMSVRVVGALTMINIHEQWARYIEKRLPIMPGVFFKFGLMPPAYYPGFSEEFLLRATSDPLCVAVGPCGLSLYKNHIKDDNVILAKQSCTLRLHLRVAVTRRLPVVVRIVHRNKVGRIHELAQTTAMNDLCSVLPSHHKVCVQNFTGNRHDYQLWQSKFPNVKFGFTYASSHKNPEVFTMMRPDQILLESESPLQPPTEDRKNKLPNTPFYLGVQVRFLAKLLNTPDSILARILNTNCCSFYNIPEHKLL